jgi:hypothetical protein
MVFEQAVRSSPAAEAERDGNDGIGAIRWRLGRTGRTYQRNVPA